MKKPLDYQDHSTPVLSGKQLLFPLDVEYQVDLKDPVRWVDAFVDTLTDQEVSPARSSLRGRKQTHTDRCLLKICLMAAVLAQNTSRQIEELCRYDLRFRWLLGSLPPPDHTTLWRFMKRMRPQMPILLQAWSRWLYQAGLISSDHLFIDGTKIESAANRYTFVWKKCALNQLEKLTGKMPSLLQRVRDEVATDEVAFCLENSIDTLSLLQEVVSHTMRAQGIHSVSGKGSKKHEMQRLLEEIEQSLERVIRYERQLEICGTNRHSFSKTDPDATFMRMKDDHMRNGQLKPAYNLTIGVNSEFIVCLDLSQDRTDYNRLPSILEQTRAVFGQSVSAVVADAGYDALDNYQYCQDHAIDAYIKPQFYEAQKKKAYWKNPKNWRTMVYHPENDTFHCLGGRVLDYQGLRREKTSRKQTIEKRVYECRDCGGCALKERCTTRSGNRQIHWNHELELLQQRSQALIQSERGILLRLNRSIQAEGCFASLKSQRKRSRLRHYGMEKCLAELFWEAMGHNVRKLSRKLERENPKQHLHLCSLKAA